MAGVTQVTHMRHASTTQGDACVGCVRRMRLKTGDLRPSATHASDCDAHASYLVRVTHASDFRGLEAPEMTLLNNLTGSSSSSSVETQPATHSDAVRSEASEISHSLDWFPEPELEEKALPGILTETSYTLPEGLNIGKWLAIGETLQRMERSVQWWLGDWWNYGERRYGEMASQASKDAVQDATGHTYQTVRNAGIVAEKFESARRRADVPFSYHEAVSALPPDEADGLLDEAVVEGWKRAEIREQAKDRKQAIAVEAALSQPAPAPEVVPWNVRVDQADARKLPLTDGSVHLTVTSPPYALDKAYQDGDVPVEDWRAFMYAWYVEAYRVTTHHGRLAVNVPLDTTLGGFRATYATAAHMAMAAGWTYRSTIVWFDDQLGKSTARGSLDSPAAPHIIAGAEMIALFSKGEWKRETPDLSAPERQRGPVLGHDDWLTWTNGVWRFPGEAQAWEGHPAPFPYELPRRLVLLLSFPGDTVLDPFCGSGTTVLAAGRLGRQAIGFDIAQAYVDSTLRRVAHGRGR